MWGVGEGWTARRGRTVWCHLAVRSPRGRRVLVGRMMDVMLKLLVVGGRKWRELLIRVGREVVRMMRTVTHKRWVVRVARPVETCQSWGLPRVYVQTGSQ